MNEARQIYQSAPGDKAVVTKKERPPTPMDEHRDKVIEVVKNSKTTLVAGETGSGKSTRVPIFLLENFPNAKIIVTEPRRVAARSVATYVAECAGEKIGGKIGYQVRFDDQTTEGTRVNFMTDGILLGKLQRDPLLKDYDIVMVDEAHERSLNIDLLLGLLKHAQSERAQKGLDPLKIVITSATIEKEKFAKYFDDAPTVEVPGRMYPVDVEYEERQIYGDDYTKIAAERVQEIVNSKEEGDILIFMPGEAEIRSTIQQIEKFNMLNVDILPLYGSMSPEDQDRIFKKNPKRKIIVATNIAETSVTIDGVRFVVDSGLIKQKEFNPETGIEALKTEYHAKSGCKQRMGRAGRTAPGKCYRLYTENQFNELNEFQTPEIARSNLDHVILTMKKMGIEDVRGFEFIDQPKREAIDQAIETLKMLGALDEQEKLTDIGKTMSELPLRPEKARMVIEAQKYGCVGKICTIAAMIGEKVFVRPRDKEAEADLAHSRFKISGSDFLKLLEVWQQWEASGFNSNWARDNFLNIKQLFEIREVRSQLMKVLRHQNISVDDKNGKDLEVIEKCVASGLIQHLMSGSGRRGYAYIDPKKNNDSSIYIHPGSAAFYEAPPFMVGFDVVDTKKPYARMCQRVKLNWLPEIAPQLLNEKRIASYNPITDQVDERVEYSFSGHYNVISSREGVSDNPEVRTQAFIRSLVAGRVDLPCVEYNNKVLETLRELSLRSDGRVSLPDLSLWYAEKLDGIANRKDALAVDDRLRLSVDDYCPVGVREEIDKRRPDKVSVKGYEFSVSYEYYDYDYLGSLGNWGYYMIIDIPQGVVSNLNTDDFLTIENNYSKDDKHTTILYKSGDLREENFNELKEKIYSETVSGAWDNFEFNTPSINVKPLKPIPTLESLGVVPVVYAKDRSGQDLMAYPAYNYVGNERNSVDGGYVHKLDVVYLKTEDEAIKLNDRSLAKKNEVDLQGQKQIDQELLPLVQEKYDALDSIMQNLLATHKERFSSSDFNEIQIAWRNVRALTSSGNSSLKDVLNAIEVVNRIITRKEKEYEQKLTLIPKATEHLESLAASFPEVYEINAYNYNKYGLLFEEYLIILNKWNEENRPDIRTQDFKITDPQMVINLCKRLEKTFLRLRKKPEEDETNEAEEYEEEEEEIEDEPVVAKAVQYRENNPNDPGVLSAASLQEAFGQPKRDKKPKETPEHVEVSKVEVPKVNVIQNTRELLTEEFRIKLTQDLKFARFFFDFIRTVPEPESRTPNADKIIKLRGRIADAKKELYIIEQELITEDDGGRMRGRVAEILRRSEKMVEDLARMQDVRMDWPNRYKQYITRALEIAKKQEVVFDEKNIKTLELKISELAQKRGEIEDLDGEIESIIIDSI